MVRKHRDTIIGISAIATLYVVMEAIGITCPIKFVTGVSCAGCGMSRAWISLLHGDVAGAYRYHPLFLLPVVVAALLIFRKHIPEKVLKWTLIAIAALFIAVYFYRMFAGHGDVVVFEPEKGVFGWLIN